MLSNAELISLFFHDLKQYNSTNFRKLVSGDIHDIDPEIIKAFSSVITRYFIFMEKHPELSNTEFRVLYYKLKIDMIARYFTMYPDSNPEELLGFQLELRNYLNENRGVDDDTEALEV